MDTSKTSNDIYQQLKSMLAIEDIDTSPSELHGVICARVCLESEATAIPQWLPLITGEPLAPGMNRFFVEKLETIVAEVKKTMESGEYDLQLLLDSDDSVFLQTESIAAWCQGFVLGLLGNGEHKLELLPENSRELVRDFMEISGANSDDDSDSNEAARALMEIEEYVRIGAHVIFEDLKSQAVH